PRWSVGCWRPCVTDSVTHAGLSRAGFRRGSIVRHSGGVTDANVIDELSGPTPHDTLRQLREGQPVRRIEMPDGARVWLWSRYEDARQALGDPRLSKRMRRSSLPGSGGSPIGHHMLNADPPDHTRLRRLVSTAFTARRVERLEPRIAA